MTGNGLRPLLGQRHMETPVRYLEFAVKCDRLAKLAKSEEDRMILKEMTAVWKKLARELDRKEYSTERQQVGLNE
jgi:hypothetical protein